MDLGQGETETEDPEFLEALRDSGVVAGGDRRIRVLFERCLIACALYEEFWTKVRETAVAVPKSVTYQV